MKLLEAVTNLLSDHMYCRHVLRGWLQGAPCRYEKDGWLATDPCSIFLLLHNDVTMSYQFVHTLLHMFIFYYTNISTVHRNLTGTKSDCFLVAKPHSVL